VALSLFQAKFQLNRSLNQARWAKLLAEIALLGLQSEIKVTLFPFASRSFHANNLHYMVKLIDKAIVFNVKIHN
jgi:hypothetical protein